MPLLYSKTYDLVISKMNSEEVIEELEAETDFVLVHRREAGQVRADRAGPSPGNVGKKDREYKESNRKNQKQCYCCPYT